MTSAARRSVVRRPTLAAVIPYYCFKPKTTTTTTAVPVCQAPCECLAKSAADAKWGQNGYTQCSQTKCGQAPTLAAVIPYYCYKPLTTTTAPTNAVLVPVGVAAINRTPVRVNTTQSINVLARVDPVIMLMDSDNDGIINRDDNCMSVPNPGQADTDPGLTVCGMSGDMPGVSYDDCVTSPPGDGVGDACDNCPAMVNPDQEDSDVQSKCSVQTADKGGGVLCIPISDGFGDACDNCPYVFRTRTSWTVTGTVWGTTAITASSGTTGTSWTATTIRSGTPATCVLRLQRTRPIPGSRTRMPCRETLIRTMTGLATTATATTGCRAPMRPALTAAASARPVSPAPGAGTR